MRDTRDPPDAFVLIEAIAAALREELGVPIEEQPGFRHADEAGQVNGAFRIMVRTILGPGIPSTQDPSAALSDVLRRLARRRLEAGLLDAHEVEHLLRLEFDGRDDWLVYLILAPGRRSSTSSRPAAPTGADAGPSRSGISASTPSSTTKGRNS